MTLRRGISPVLLALALLGVLGLVGLPLGDRELAALAVAVEGQQLLGK